MLKVSEDGRKLDKCDGLHVENVATWLGDGTLYLYGIKIRTRGDCDSLVDFITCGPPKKKWRITRTFKAMPLSVTVSGIPVEYGEKLLLSDSDIEEV